MKIKKIMIETGNTLKKHWYNAKTIMETVDLDSKFEVIDRRTIVNKETKRDVNNSNSSGIGPYLMYVYKYYINFQLIRNIMNKIIEVQSKWKY